MTVEAATPGAPALQRVALGVSYDGRAYNGWQSQADGNTVQDQLETALQSFATGPKPSTLCAGRTDAGVHGLMQVVHFDTPITRDPLSWVRGTNRYLPRDIAIQWAHFVPREFHARASALTRRYAYILYAGRVRPTIDRARVGWIHHSVDVDAMRAAASCLTGTHDFSSFRASQCQSHKPINTLEPILRGQCVLAPHDSKHRGVPGRYWYRPTTTRVVKRGVGRPKSQCRLANFQR